jgi:2-(1,2-epoxy-1,2-dihydrophenyl)acetyl-CoA isomerase
MTYREILLRRHGPVATIVLHRPEKLNAFTFPMLAEMNDAVAALATDETPRALVLTGEGRAFSAGDDLGGMGGTDPPNDIRGGHHRLVKQLRALRMPVVAALNGFTLGAGFDLALACDFRIAAHEAELGDVRVPRAMCSMSGAAFWLPRLIGLARATELLLLGDRITATRALELGIVNAVVPRSELDVAVASFVDRLLALPTGALGAQKACVEFGRQHSLDESLEHEMQELVQGFAREDWSEAIRAFAEKRPPRFTGR